MNRVELAGRLTRDPEVRYSTGENATAVARFSLAVNRKFKNKEGNYDADFPNCIAFGKTAEFVEKFFHKGDFIIIDSGRIQTGRYTNKDGVTVYTTDVVVDSVEFGGGKSDSAPATGGGKSRTDNSFMNIPDGIDEELPFN